MIDEADQVPILGEAPPKRLVVCGYNVKLALFHNGRVREKAWDELGIIMFKFANH